MTETTQDCFFESNGVPIRYRVQGSGQPVILMHGMTGRIESWDDIGFFDHPHDGLCFIPMDCRGHGKSGKPHSPSAYGQEMVDDVVRLLDHLEIRRAHVMGHSTGAEIALKMAAQYPARVQSAVLTGSGWSDQNLYELCAPLAESLERGEGLRAYFDWGTPPGQSRTADEIEQFEEWNQAMLARNDAQALAAMCRNYAELEELRMTEEEVRAIKVPMLGVTGEFNPERHMLERMRGVAPDFTMIVLPGLGHGGPEFFRALREKAFSFLREVGLQEV
jgi:pimeloyl-ACP methyl ester carboxylesterase